MFVHRLLKASAILALSTSPVLGQAKATYTALFSSDSLVITSPALSPNRKWVAFAARAIGKGNSESAIMIIPATGGTPRKLTSDGHTDAQPVWFPGSDRIVFRSTRVADALMTLRISANGEAQGAPQRLTLQTVQPFGFAPSPDGKSVFFTTSHENDPQLPELMVVPANGGTARLLARIPKGRVVQAWWPHADSIFYSVLTPPFPSSRFSAWHIPAAGGTPRQIGISNESQGFTVLAPGYLLRGAVVRMNGDTLGTLSLTTLRGDTLLRFDTRGSTAQTGLNFRVRPSQDGRTIMLAASTSSGATRLLPVEEVGVPRNLEATRGEWYMNSGYPYGFTADGSAAWVHVRGEGQVMKLVPLAGGQARAIQLPADAMWPYPTKSGKYIYVWGGHPVDSLRSLHIVDVVSGRTELISATAGEIESGRDGDDIYYLESVRGGALDVRRWSPGKGSMLVQRIPAGRFYQRFSTSAALAPDAKAFAYARVNGDSTHLLVGDSSGAHPVLSVRGRPRNFAFSRGGRILVGVMREVAGRDSVQVAYAIELDDRQRIVGTPKVIARTAAGGNFTWPAFSPDGQTMALGVEHSDQAVPQVGLLLSSIDDKTREVGPPRRVDIPRPSTEWDDIGWSGDGKYVLLTTYAASINRTLLWRVAAKGDAAPVNLAANEKNVFWEVIASQDGRYVAYQADLPARTTIWRIDLPAGIVR
jgi:Tol biopolymer transport system component